jgi:Carbohydrate-binding module 48 (Isoamylase N-terminal domain)
MGEHDELPVILRDAVRVMREPAPPPSDLWRRRLLKAVAATPAPSTRRSFVAPRRWSFHPLQALAAAVLCVVVGSVATLLLVPRARQRVAVERPADAGVSQVRFTLVAPGAASVSIVGDFNGWNPTALPMRRAADGRTWLVDVPLSPGRYAYAFVVDGALARDPSAPQTRDDDFGTPNSIVMVSGS